jgi:thiol-disulfide isomerase/thioredoxin
MSSSVVVVLAVLVAALGLAYLIGKLLTLRSGMLRDASKAAELSAEAVAELGLSTSGPTILHFSADWCGPCAAVRRVVDQVCADLPRVSHLEVDMDANPELAKRLSVLSLPTTIVFDSAGRAQFRISGVPKAADLRSALEPLLA